MITPGNMRLGQLENASQPEPQDTPRPASVADMKDPKCQARDLGFVRGVYVERKTIKDGLMDSNVFRITSTETGIAKLDEITHNDEASCLSVEFEALMEFWKLKNESTVPDKMPLYSADLCNPFLHASWELAAAKGACLIALRATYEKHQAAAKMLHMYKNPTLMRAAVDIAGGRLKLVAAGTEISNKESSQGVCMGKFEINKNMQELYLMPKVSLPLDKSGNINENPFVAPFWHLLAVEDKKDVNMRIAWEVAEVGGYTVKVPVATNTKKIQKGQVLQRLRTKGCLKPPWTTEEKDSKRQRVE